MKIVKISAIWCGGCLVMNKIWHKILDNYQIEAIELDYDMDEEEVKKYNPGNILPVFIFFSNNHEVARLIGEVKYETIAEKIEKLGELDEKNT